MILCKFYRKFFLHRNVDFYITLKCSTLHYQNYCQKRLNPNWGFAWVQNQKLMPGLSFQHRTISGIIVCFRCFTELSM